jgi:hypothetical protein
MLKINFLSHCDKNKRKDGKYRKARFHWKRKSLMKTGKYKGLNPGLAVPPMIVPFVFI